MNPRPLPARWRSFRRANTVVAVCPECRVERTQCDEDGCCLSCGVDLIRCADRNAADLLLGYVADLHEWVESCIGGSR